PPVEAIFISGGGPDRLDAILHLLRRFAFAPQFIKRHAAPVAGFGVGRAFVQKLIEHFQRVLELVCVIIHQAGFAPDFILAMRWVQLYDSLEMPYRFVQAPLLPGDAPELVMRIDFLWIDFDRALERSHSRVLLATLLVNQSQLVMSRSVIRIERRRLQVLSER